MAIHLLTGSLGPAISWRTSERSAQLDRAARLACHDTNNVAPNRTRSVARVPNRVGKAEINLKA